MKFIIIINDAPYGTEKMYNALRLAMSIQKEVEGCDVSVFLMGDAVTGALPGQNTPQGYYNIERMLKAVLQKKGRVKLCGTCLDARGMHDLTLVSGTERSTMVELAQLTAEADKVLTF